MNLCQTFTHPFTAPFRPWTFTRPADLHERASRERETPFTQTFTTFTRPDLHARGGLYIETPGQNPPIRTLEMSPR